jgi:lipoprotein NlpI
VKPCVDCGREHCNDRPTCFDCTRQRPEYDNKYEHIQFVNDDPFRKAWLGNAEQKAAEQQRHIDPEAPKDRFEAKERHERLGRIYIGDDLSPLSKRAQKAISHGQGVKAGL